MPDKYLYLKQKTQKTSIVSIFSPTALCQIMHQFRKKIDKCFIYVYISFVYTDK